MFGMLYDNESKYQTDFWIIYCLQLVGGTFKYMNIELLIERRSFYTIFWSKEW